MAKRVLLALALLSGLCLLSPLLAEGSKVVFYVYGSEGCSHCVEVKETLIKDFPNCTVVFYELRGNSTNLSRFHEICKLIGNEGGVIPVVGIFINGELKAVNVGSVPKDLVARVNSTRRVPLGLYFNGFEYDMIWEEGKVKRLEELFTGRVCPSLSAPTNFVQLLLPVILGSLADSVNPCAFNVLIIFLTLAALKVGRGKVLGLGMSFASAVLLAYYLMGLGLIKVFAALPQLRYLIAAFGLGVGSLNVLNFLCNREASLVPKGLGEAVVNALYKVMSPKGAFLCGLLVSFFLLPCTSGPYFVVTSLISRKATLLCGLALLMIYNLIFVAPFVGITLALHYLGLRTLDLKKFKARRGKLMELVAGLLLIGISVYSLVG